MASLTANVTEVAVMLLTETSRRLGGHADAYDPVKGGLMEGPYELWLLMLVTVLVISLGSLAAGAGIGGGGLFVPIFAFALGVGAKAAVPMSKATILGGALGNMISIAFARHPDPAKDRPLIDYEASTFMQSGELLGVIFGVLLNMILPEIAIIVFLAALLSFNGYKTVTKGIEKYKKETKEFAKAAEPCVRPGDFEHKEPKPLSLGNMEEGFVEYALTNDGSGLAAIELGDIIMKEVEDVDMKTDTTESGPPSAGSNDGSNSTEGSPTESRQQSKQSRAETEAIIPDDVERARSAELEKLIREDAMQFPRWPWALLATMTAYTVLYAFVKKSLLNTCQPVSYWLWYFSPVPVLLGFMYVTVLILKKTHERRIAAGYRFAGDGETAPAYRDMKWTDESLKKFPSIALLAGVSAGLLGIGGGMVIGPLFIQLDMQPKVGASSCAFMILWTATSGVVQYWFAGKIGLEFIAYGIAIGMISGQLGQRIVDAALKKSGRPSYVIFLLGAIVLVACAAMTTTGTVKLIKGIGEGEDLFSFDLYDFQCHPGVVHDAGGH